MTRVDELRERIKANTDAVDHVGSLSDALALCFDTQACLDELERLETNPDAILT